VSVGGRPLLEWSVEALLAAPSISQVVVALPEGAAAPAGCLGVEGGSERSLSVRNALAAAEGDPVLVCDAARPLLSVGLIEAVLSGLAGADAAIAAAPVTDTVKKARPDGTVVRTLDRSALWAVQTPQAFRREALERALAQPDDVVAAATDDASLIEALGGTVRVVRAPHPNPKVTEPADLLLAERLLAAR
jgi:2-C-methyl-D-erythritol 4-phosphate cytidylyltransferase